MAVLQLPEATDAEGWLPICDRSRTKELRLRFVVTWSDALLGVERTSKRRLRRAARLAKGYPNPIARARKYEAAIANGSSQAEVARQFGVTRQEVCQYVTVFRRLPGAVIAQVEAERDPMVLRRLSLQRLLLVARSQASMTGLVTLLAGTGGA